MLEYASSQSYPPLAQSQSIAFLPLILTSELPATRLQYHPTNPLQLPYTTPLYSQPLPQNPTFSPLIPSKRILLHLETLSPFYESGLINEAMDKEHGCVSEDLMVKVLGGPAFLGYSSPVRNVLPAEQNLQGNPSDEA